MGRILAGPSVERMYLALQPPQVSRLQQIHRRELQAIRLALPHQRPIQVTTEMCLVDSRPEQYLMRKRQTFLALLMKTFPAQQRQRQQQQLHRQSFDLCSYFDFLFLRHCPFIVI